jgi:phosphoglycerate dehydrogenase-like enzyme
MSPLTVLLWGRAEYERHASELYGLPVRVIEHAGDDAPLEDADVLVVPSRQPVRSAHIPRLQRAKLVLTTTSGFDHLDVAALYAAGIPCARLPLARRDAVVQSALGMLLSLNRRLGALQTPASQGTWDRSRLPMWGPALLGTVGVVGHGVIGSAMASALEAMGAHVLRCDPVLADSVPLAELTAQSDAITLHCELTPETRNLFDRERIASMRRGAVLINTARGRLLDVDAALDAVHSAHLAGLGLDVFPSEPPPELARFVHPRCIVTPHAAGWHPDLDRYIMDGIRSAVSAVLTATPIPFRIAPPKQAAAGAIG